MVSVVELTDTQIRQLEQRLRQQLAELQEEVRKARGRSDAAEREATPREARDVSEEAVAGMELDLSVAHLRHYAEEIRVIEQALARIDSGDYGFCIDCGDAIGFARLDVWPAAKRCVQCQAKREQRD